LLKGDSAVTMNCKAIMSVCRGTGEGSEDLIEVSLAAALLCLNVVFCISEYNLSTKSSSILSPHQYWNKFFVGYGYADKQKEDIALVVSEFC
jgi:hypothetical protein